MLRFLDIICFNISILLIWFKTDAFVEYCKLLKIKIPLNTTNTTYPQFLYLTYKNEKTLRSFVIKLITCPVCLGFWLSVLTGILFADIFSIPILFIATITYYLLLCKII
jgi:hypothetical protein